jgi:hypothetical protein
VWIGNLAVMGAPGPDELTRVTSGRGRADDEWPKAKDEDGTLPLTPTPDISPYDSFLRQAVEKFIALVKECVLVNQGTLDTEHIKRLNIIHDCIVDMVEDMRKE